MNHATGAVAPLDQEMVQVGHAIWQRAERRGLIQGSVRPVVVVEVFVRAQNGHQVPLIPDQGPVQQFSAAVADPPPMIEFICGAWTAERIILAPAAWNTASKVAVKQGSWVEVKGASRQARARS
jgi:hypothetical protein